MTRARENADGARLDAPLLSPALVTPNLGTPSAGTMTNMTGAVEASLVDNAVTLAKMAGGPDGNLITYDTSGDPAYVATGTSGHVLTSAGADAVPVFAAAAGGGKYVLEEFDNFYYATATSTTTLSADDVNLSDSNYCTMATGTNTSDLLTFEMNFGNLHRSGYSSFLGIGFQRATDTGFSANVAFPWRSGEHAWGTGTEGDDNNYLGHQCVTKTRTVSDWGLSASTTYYFRLIGQTHNQAGTFTWGQGATDNANSTGVLMAVMKWSLT